jgi:hypothetical protein
VWEGKASWARGGYESPSDGEMSYQGKFRRMSPEEAEKVQAGLSPWPDTEEEDEED